MLCVCIIVIFIALFSVQSGVFKGFSKDVFIYKNTIWYVVTIWFLIHDFEMWIKISMESVKQRSTVLKLERLYKQYEALCSVQGLTVMF